MGTSIKENETPGLDCAVVKTKFPGIVGLALPAHDHLVQHLDDGFLLPICRRSVHPGQDRCLQRAIGHVRHGRHRSGHNAYDSGRQRGHGARRHGLRHQRDDPRFQRFPQFPHLTSRPGARGGDERDGRTDGSQPLADDRRGGVVDVSRGRGLHPSGARRAGGRDRADEAAGDAAGGEHVRVDADRGEVQPRAIHSKRGADCRGVQVGDAVDGDAESRRGEAHVETSCTCVYRCDGVRSDGPRDESGAGAGAIGGLGGGHAADHSPHGARGEPSKQQLESV